MPQKRMLNSSISTSERVDKLSTSAKLFYTWSIAHADDFGMLPTSIKRLKSLVVPYWKRSAEDLENIVKEILDNDLWIVVNVGKKDWYFFTKWLDHQTLRKDYVPRLFANIKVKWEDYEELRKKIKP